jgi:hypothetical protein
MHSRLTAAKANLTDITDAARHAPVAATSDACGRNGTLRGPLHSLYDATLACSRFASISASFAVREASADLT